MPRIRSVHPDICEDDTLPDVSSYAERTFVRMWTHMDEQERGVVKPDMLGEKEHAFFLPWSAEGDTDGV